MWFNAMLKCQCRGAPLQSYNWAPCSCIGNELTFYQSGYFECIRISKLNLHWGTLSLSLSISYYNCNIESVTFAVRVCWTCICVHHNTCSDISVALVCCKVYIRWCKLSEWEREWGRRRASDSIEEVCRRQRQDRKNIVSTEKK